MREADESGNLVHNSDFAVEEDLTDDVNWIRYYPDTSVELGSDWELYEYEFDMNDEDDDNGRVEFNMGSQGSTATVHIRNVRLEVVQ